MSETIQIVKITKTRPGNLLMMLHPASNFQLSKEVYLTDRSPSQNVPLDWALGIFLDNGLYEQYKSGYFTFNDNEAVVKAAYEHGVYFDEALDFVPASKDNSEIILTILKAGNRAQILEAIEKYSSDVVRDVAIQNVPNLTHNVIRMLEDIFKVQLTLDGE